MNKSVTFALLVFVAGQVCAGGYYKWTDKDGGLHFGSSSPPGVEAEDLNAKSQGDIDAKTVASEMSRSMPRKRSIKEIESDQLSFIGRGFEICGMLSVSSYYNYKWRNAQSEYLAFDLKDQNHDRATVYGVKYKFGDLRQIILHSPGEEVHGCWQLRIPMDRYDKDALQLLPELDPYAAIKVNRVQKNP